MFYSENWSGSEPPPSGHLDTGALRLEAAQGDYLEPLARIDNDEAVKCS